MNYDMFEKEEGFNPVKEEYYEIENITDYFKIIFVTIVKIFR